mmetsp:Transcript_68123/g.127208  ORF Transcript_68123/g.127208 Transcript_68123/m.127208 type:complete len:172 (+) Transcript_68123:54-569(+)
MTQHAPQNQPQGGAPPQGTQTGGPGPQLGIVRHTMIAIVAPKDSGPSKPGQPVCQRPNCPTPTYDGAPGYCSRWCRDQHQGAPASGPVCKRCGKYPTFDGKPGFCSKTCRDAKAPQAGAPGGVVVVMQIHRCQRPGCQKPTYDNKPGFCSRTCRDWAKARQQQQKGCCALL